MNKRILSVAVIAAMMATTTQIQAAGFQLAEYSATGLGRAYAGEAAMADNAAAQFRNPAMLTYLQGTQVTTGAILVIPNIDVDGEVSFVDGTSPTSAKDIAGDAVVPNFYVSHQLNEQWFLGLALGSNFGMATELDDSFRGNQFGNEAAVTTIEINPNVAYRINEQFSVGAGVRFVIGEGSFGAQSSSDLIVPEGTTLKYMEGDDISWGWQLGSAWQINADHRIGVNYRSEVEQTLEGEANGLGFSTLEGSFDANKVYAGSMDLTLPATAEIASFHQLTDKFAVHASVNWTDWSSFEKLEAKILELSNVPILVKEENWEDNYRFAVGATYAVSSKSTLRAGVAYDQSAVDDINRTATIPEVDRLWLSVGYGYQYSDNLDLDFGVTYIFADESPMDENETDSLPFGGTFEGQVSGNILLVGVQASYRF
ncbi:outer membrane protein transport protein [Shewanella sp. D64]|uniref:outer membrane protein transport protein n=1 Tax=unclassified Shewanella TaxID=196818 RepID=UPI0022BA6861|nr:MULTISPECIES: outer membrane protein transport protein [unclassified Shewanella]MEC4726764.1 outer membrane protein transport protein [Shewanella sp. D64]MEC4739124.1 outer membrane protein transport protein [Shewanella sp. E94]WBJ95980.1 outer membrane protein transport protein [Shewanella sp. MTB7]